MATRKIRVGVSGHDLKFWYPLQRALEATGKYEFREDVWSSHDDHDAAASRAILEWADLLVAEWALGNAVYYARHKRQHQRLIIRLHLQERTTKYPAEIDYSKVDSVVFVGAHILRECIEKFSIPADICTVLGNFIDVGKYNLPKFGGSEFTVGIIGTAPSRKRLDLAVDTLALLTKKDDRYLLRVKGASPASIPWLWARNKEREYYQQIYSRINEGNLRHKVIFDPQGHDVHHWLQMVGSILSPSDFESFHMAVSEGAASGALPVVWSWEGANEIYPEFGLVDSPEQAADQIEFHNRSAAGTRYRRQIREIIRSRYDSAVIVEKWEGLLSQPLRLHTRVHPVRGGSRGLLVVWAIDNWGTFHRKEMLQALAANLDGDCDLLVIEPGNHFEAIAKLGWASASELARIASGDLIHEGSNVFRVRLLTGGIPATVSKAGYQECSNNPLSVLDGLITHHFGPDRNVLHWVYKPDQAQRLSGKYRYVYEVYDDYTVDFGTGEPIATTLQAELEILPGAEHVFLTSQPLLERKGAAAKQSSLIGNGVNLDAFARFRLLDHTAGGRPVAGYLGNLSDFFDWELMLAVCELMPEVDFVFHGQIEKEKLGARKELLNAMCRLSNVLFTGRVTRELGATAVNRYDVLLIPFVVNDAMHAVNPLKLWEYFATGRPVVSTPMEAIQEAQPLVVIANGVQEWVEAIDQCLNGDAAGEEVVRARIAEAELRQWNLLTMTHADVVRGIFNVTGKHRLSVLPGIDLQPDSKASRMDVAEMAQPSPSCSD